MFASSFSVSDGNLSNKENTHLESQRKITGMLQQNTTPTNSLQSDLAQRPELDHSATLRELVGNHSRSQSNRF